MARTLAIGTRKIGDSQPLTPALLRIFFTKNKYKKMKTDTIIKKKTIAI